MATADIKLLWLRIFLLSQYYITLGSGWFHVRDLHPNNDWHHHCLAKSHRSLLQLHSWSSPCLLFKMSFVLVDLRVNFGLHLNCRTFGRRHVSLLAEHGTSTKTGNRTVPPPTLQQTVYLVIFSQWVRQLHNLLPCNCYQHLVGHPWVIQWQTGDKDDESVSTTYLNLYMSEKLNRAERYKEKEVFNTTESATALTPNGGLFLNSSKNV